MSSYDLTPPRERIMQAIRTFTAEHHYPPSMTDLGKMVGLTKSTIHFHLNGLVAQGRITRAPKVARGIVVIEDAPDGQISGT
jgi:repressor LexA